MIDTSDEIDERTRTTAVALPYQLAVDNTPIHPPLYPIIRGSNGSNQ